MNKPVWSFLLGITLVVSSPAAFAHGKHDVAKLSTELVRVVAASKVDKSSGYVFDPKALEEIAKLGVGLPTDEALDRVQQALIARYGKRIAPERHWIFNDAGTALGELTLLHCSAKEYLIFFGSPIGADGFSGRYPHAEFWDFVIQGQMQTYSAGETSMHVYNPGEYGYMARGQSKGYRIVGPTWMLEYGRGNILSAFNFGIISPARYFMRDWDSAWEQIHDCGKLAIGEIFGRKSRQASSWGE